MISAIFQAWEKKQKELPLQQQSEFKKVAGAWKDSSGVFYRFTVWSYILLDPLLQETSEKRVRKFTSFSF